LGGNGNVTSLNSSTVNIGTGAYATTVSIGGKQDETTVTATAGNSSLSLVNKNASIKVADAETFGLVSIVNQGEDGSVLVDKNGKMVLGQSSETSAALVVGNSVGNIHGLVVQESQTTLSGGSNSTSMTLSDGGAAFSNSSNGAPVIVTGVADGKSDFDAVNVRQFAGALAAVVASANIPDPNPGNSVSIGVGVGSFMGKSALAFGGNYRMSANSMIKGSLAMGVNRGDASKPVLGLGAGWSW
jgi:hypothetical protein